MSRATMRANAGAWWLTTAPADMSAPTQGEITAGTAIMGVAGGEALADWGGITSSVSDINVPDGLSMSTGTLPGERTLGVATLQYYIDKTNNPIRDLLVEGTEGYLVLAPISRANAVGDECVALQVQVQKSEPDWQLGNAGATRTISFSKGQQVNGEIA